MGYDCHFQLIDGAATSAMLEALIAGTAPPPSAFDALPEAPSVWARARELLLGADRPAAARAVGELVAHWNAASLAFVWTRNLAATYHPIRMESALQGLPSHCFLSPSWTLFNAMPMDLEWSGRIEGNAQIGGYVVEVDEASRGIRALYDDVHEPLQRRLRPVLALFRAAERRGLTVLESTDLLGVTSAHESMLHWPGLARFGLDGGPLSAAEWSAFAAASPSASDLHDALERVLECDPRDEAARRAVLSLLIDHHELDWRRDERQRIAQWIARCASSEDRELAARALPLYDSAAAIAAVSTDERALLELLATATEPAVIARRIEQYGPAQSWGPPRETLVPSPRIAAALLEAMCRLAPRFDGVAPGYYARHLLRCGASKAPFALLLDSEARVEYLHEVAMDLDGNAIDDEHAEALFRSVDAALARDAIGRGAARWYGQELARLMRAPADAEAQRARRESASERWCALYDRAPEIGPSYTDDALTDHAFVERVVERLLRAPRPHKQLRAVAAALQATLGWEDDEGPWIAPFCERNAEALRALIALGLASDDPADRRAASALRAPAPMRDELH